MRTKVSLAVAALSLVALVIVSMWGSAVQPAVSSRTNAQPLPPLQIARSSQNGWRYTLDSLTSCRVGDGLAVVRDTALLPLRVLAVRLVVAGDDTPSTDVRSFRVVSVDAGSTSGEVAGTFHLSAVNDGRSGGVAVGSVLQSVRSSHRWYDIEALLQLTANHPAPWQIQGMKVTYGLGSRSYSTTFAQSVRLPATVGCNST